MSVEMDAGSPEHTPEMIREAIIARNNATVDQHFHNENPEGIDLAIAVYPDRVNDDIHADAVVTVFD
ncbi:hypothetical protein [Dactylosporangium sp. NPDC000521]|uniref:hypothetical protein n=1 Tax=Dactylosporangium sp. NPDC000521 TaxID=3363975 RepID=UPI0036B29430